MAKALLGHVGGPDRWLVAEVAAAGTTDRRLGGPAGANARRERASLGGTWSRAADYDPDAACAAGDDRHEWAAHPDRRRGTRMPAQGLAPRRPRRGPDLADDEDAPTPETGPQDAGLS